MLEFDLSFFEDEIRNDFLVDSTMKSVWAAELEVLQEIAIICERHNLKWFATYGTLIGVVRHEGFIPWDDDIDIMMLRDDYMELLEYLPEELPEGFDVRCPLICVDDAQGGFQCTVFNSDSVSIEPEHLRRFHGCPFIVGIDIYPIDYIHRDENENRTQIAVFKLIRKLVWIIKNEVIDDKNLAEINKGIKTLNEVLGANLEVVNYNTNLDLINNELWRLANIIVMGNNGNATEKVTQFVRYSNNEEVVFDVSWFKDVIYGSFEQILLPIPKSYDEILNKMYRNYKEMVKGGASHDYPVYKSQLEMLRKKYQEWEEKTKNK